MPLPNENVYKIFSARKTSGPLQYSSSKEEYIPFPALDASEKRYALCAKTLGLVGPIYPRFLHWLVLRDA